MNKKQHVFFVNSLLLPLLIFSFSSVAADSSHSSLDEGVVAFNEGNHKKAEDYFLLKLNNPTLKN